MTYSQRRRSRCLRNDKEVTEKTPEGPEGRHQQGERANYCPQGRILLQMGLFRFLVVDCIILKIFRTAEASSVNRSKNDLPPSKYKEKLHKSCNLLHECKRLFVHFVNWFHNKLLFHSQFNLNLILKHGDVAQWESARFACGRPRVRSPASPRNVLNEFF